MVKAIRTEQFLKRAPDNEFYAQEDGKEAVGFYVECSNLEAALKAGGKRAKELLGQYTSLKVSERKPQTEEDHPGQTRVPGTE